MRSRSLIVGSILALLAAPSCRSAEADAIRIGVLADCEGFAAGLYDLALAGAELPLLSRGGELGGAQLDDGVHGVSVGGHAIELSFGCAGESVGAILETRRLVELEGVDVVIGPNVFPNTRGIFDYALRHPSTVFVLATMEHLEGLPLRSNVFRFTADSVQTAAGLGSYAFNELGWQRAATIASADLWEWGISTGFVGEFCSLGGTIADRYWLDVATEDLPDAVRRIPLDPGIGYLVAADAGSAARFLRRFADEGAVLARDVVVGPLGSAPIALDPALVRDLGARLTGLVTASFVPLDRSDPTWNSYVAEFGSTFPSLAEGADSTYHLFDIDYFNAMEAVLLALEEVGGDLGDGAQRFQRSLAASALDAPNGTITLDQQQHAVVRIYLSKVVEDPDGTLTYRTFDTIDGVDDTYGGALRIEGALPDRTQPRCVEGSPPPWASAG